VAGDIEHITNEKVHPTLNIKSTTMIQSEVWSTPAKIHQLSHEFSLSPKWYGSNKARPHFSFLLARYLSAVSLQFELEILGDWFNNNDWLSPLAKIHKT
jgi:hypothetical protein